MIAWEYVFYYDIYDMEPHPEMNAWESMLALMESRGQDGWELIQLTQHGSWWKRSYEEGGKKP